MSRGSAGAQVILIRVAFGVALLLVTLAMAALPSPVGAQTWPTTWRLIDTDVNEPGGANYRDVTEASWSCDTNHLYLRLRTVDPPTFNGAAGPARYKWFLDVGNGPNIYQSGGNILGTDFLLFVEDSDNDGDGDIYLVPSNGNDSFSQYEPWNSTSFPATDNSSIASFRITGNYVDMWVSFEALGRT